MSMFILLNSIMNYGDGSLALGITCDPTDGAKVSSQLLFTSLIVIYLFIPLFHFQFLSLLLTDSLFYLLLPLSVATWKQVPCFGILCEPQVPRVWLDDY